MTEIGIYSEKNNLYKETYRIKKIMGLNENIEDINYTSPNFDIEWDEANRYIDHPNYEKRINWTKQEWLDKVKKGKVMKFSEIRNLENLSTPEEFYSLEDAKIHRFLDAFSKKVIELPIVAKFSNGLYELIAGNTRLTGLLMKGIDPKIWVFELDDIKR